MQEVSITTEGIQKNLKNFKPLDELFDRYGLILRQIE